jgi:serine/threonine protein kinase
MFSAGCIFYELMFNKRFFAGEDSEEVFINNKNFPVRFMESYTHLSIELAKYNSEMNKEGLKLVHLMLQIMPSKRISAKRALEHQYFA